MIEQLFGSKTRVKLLQLFYTSPNRSYYVREITRKIDEQINSVRRELANLLSIGIISSETTNNRLYYEVDQSYEFYKPLATVFGKGGAKTSHAASTTKSLDQDIASIGNVELAMYTGHFTRDETGGIDVLIVGDVNQTKLTKYMIELERQEGKELRYTVLSLQNFKYRQKVNDRFLSMVLAAKRQVVVDKHYLLTPKPKKTKSDEQTEEEKS